jgi:carbon storage regulator
MLVLSRSKNESINIGDEVTIVVIEVRGDKVRLGIEAPPHVPVHRREVYEAICGYHRQQGFSEVAPPTPDMTPCSAAPAATACAAQPRSAVNPVVEAPPVRDGLCCPSCGSDAVDVARIKAAYQGRELVRRRQCTICGHEFHTIERVELL